MRKHALSLLFLALAGFGSMACAANPFGNQTNLWLANGYAGNIDTNGASIAMAKVTSIVAFTSSYTPPDMATEQGVSVFQKINGSWTEVAFLKASSVVSSVAISDAGDVVAVADGSAIDIFQQPSAGWADAQPTIRLTMPIASSGGFFSAVSMNGTQLLATYQPAVCNTTAGCAEVATYVEPGTGWASSSSPNAVFQGSIFSPTSVSFSDSQLALSTDTIAAVTSSQIGTITQLSSDWSGGQNVYVNSLPTTLSSYCLSTGALNTLNGDAFAGNVLALLGFVTPCSYSIALLQESSSSWASPTLLATLTPSSIASLSVPFEQIAAAANTIGVARFGGDLCDLSVYIFQQPAGGWVDANETVKYSGLDPANGNYCGVNSAQGFSVSDSAIAVQTGDTVEVLDNSAIQPTVDLRATMLLAPGTSGAPANGPFQITITLTNDDTVTAPSVMLTSAIPSQLSNVAVSTTAGSCAVAAGQLKCSFGNLSSGQQVVVTLSATAPAAGTRFNEIAVVTSTLNVHSLRNSRAVLTYSTYARPTAQNITLTGYDNGSSATDMTGQLIGSDPNGLPLTYSIAQAPSNLFISLSSTGELDVAAPYQSYAPGKYEFTYVTNNGYVNSLPATVTLVIVANGNQGCTAQCGPNVNPISNVGKGSTGILINLVFFGLLGLRRLIQRK